MANTALLSRFGYQAPSSEEELGGVGAFFEMNEFNSLSPKDENDVDRMGDGAEQARSYGENNLGLYATNSETMSSATSTNYGATDGVRLGPDGRDEAEQFRAVEGIENDGYQSDAEMARADDDKKRIEEEEAKKEQPGMENVKAFQQLLAMGFTYNEIQNTSSMYGVSNQEMLDNARSDDKQQLVPEEQQAMLTARMQAQELMRDTELRDKMQDSEMAKNGVSATMAGAETSVGVARMMV